MLTPTFSNCSGFLNLLLWTRFISFEISTWNNSSHLLGRVLRISQYGSCWKIYSALETSLNLLLISTIICSNEILKRCVFRKAVVCSFFVVSSILHHVFQSWKCGEVTKKYICIWRINYQQYQSTKKNPAIRFSIFNWFSVFLPFSIVLLFVSYFWEHISVTVH